MSGSHLIRCLLFALASAALSGSGALAEDTGAKKPWDQAAVKALGEKFSKETSKAYTAIYSQGSTSGMVGSGETRDFYRLQDKARVIRDEAQHLKSALKDGKGHDQTLPIFERLMVDVRDIRVLGQRMMIQDMTRKRIDAAAETLQKLGEYYDASAFDKGPAPPLINQ